jgi:competence protein ComEC
VGQGLSAVIQTKHKVLIYDAGPGLEGRGNAASSVIIPFLRHQGIRKIDKLIISHVDNDHVGGAVTLLKSEKIKQLITSSPSFFKNFKAEHCYAGQHWQWQDVRFKMLAPFTLKQAKRNNLSCVLQITIGKTKILLPGDVEKSTESQLVKQLGNKLKSNILVAPHHGSKTSSSWKFIMAVDPQYVLYPVGHQNRFKFPAKQVVERYKLLGAKQFSTAQCGAISFMFGAKHQNLQVNCFRK